MPVRTKSPRLSSRRRSASSVRSKTSVVVPNRRPGHRRPARAAASFAPAKAPSHHGVSAYSKALKFLATLSDYERLRIVRYTSQNFDLERMRALLKKLGNPQEHFKSVHVAGTKGKGSTCSMVAAMLTACGYKVGLYTSPHLIDVRERIQINGRMITTATFARLVRTVEPL